MPISSERFERGVERDSLENRIVHYLHENRDRAFDAREIAGAVVDPERSNPTVDAPDDFAILDRVLDVAAVSSILHSLVDHGALERRIVDDGRGERNYYRSRSRRELGASD